MDDNHTEEYITLLKRVDEFRFDIDKLNKLSTLSDCLHRLSLITDQELANIDAILTDKIIENLGK